MGKIMDAEALFERLPLPPGGLQLTLWGRGQLLVREHRGILGYSEQELILAGKEGRVRIIGTELSLVAMDEKSLLVRGKIHEVQYE